jgi:hypothetical protein
MLNEIFKSVSGANFAANGDWVDTMASYYTILVYALGSIFLSASPFITGHYECRTPAQYKPGAWNKFVKQLCYIQGSWYVPFDQHIQESIETGDAFEVKYYQWVPYYLAVMSVTFLMPYFFWTSVSNVAGIDLEFLTTEASKFDVTKTSIARADHINYLAKYIDRYLDCQKPLPGKKTVCDRVGALFSCFNNKRGTMMGNAYFCHKLMYILLFAAQLYAVCKFLGHNLVWFSVEAVINNNLLTHSFDWKTVEVFPLVTFCNVTHQEKFGQTYQDWVQCAMPNNVFNERYFIFLCLWLMLVMVLMVWSCMVWFNKIFLSIRRDRFVRHVISITQSSLANDIHSFHKDKLKFFAGKYLKADGMFVFQMIEDNTSPVCASEIMCALWSTFVDNYEEEVAFRTDGTPPSKRKEAGLEDEAIADISV